MAKAAKKTAVKKARPPTARKRSRTAAGKTERKTRIRPKAGKAHAKRKTRKKKIPGPKIPKKTAARRPAKPLKAKAPAKIAPAKAAAPIPKKPPAPGRELLVPPREKPLALTPPATPLMPVQQKAPEKPAPPPHIDASREVSGPLAIPLIPALELLPEWEDRLRLKRAIFEGGLTFFSLGRNCPEYHEASIALSRSGKASRNGVGGYFIVCIKDRAGKMAGAMDGHMLENGLMSISRSFAAGPRRRQMHILLYCAALAGHQPSYILFSMGKAEFSADDGARLILLGRGFGFSILPISIPDRVFFIRRVRRELDPISSGQELSQALAPAKPLFDSSFANSLAELAGKGILPLAPLPTSPDSREHLHELRDAVAALGMPAAGLEAVLEKLRVEYVLGRKDLTPEFLS
jgi:hypothetical protein